MHFITLPDHDEAPIHCPFCGKRVIDLESDQPFAPCEHVISTFHVEGVEFEADRSPRVPARDEDGEEGGTIREQWEEIEMAGAFGFQLGQRVETRHYIVFAP